MDAKGDSDAVFIFVAATTLVTCAKAQIVLLNGAKADNIYWVLGTALTMGADSLMMGNVIAGTAITVGSRGVLFGRALAQTAVSCETGCIIGDLANCPGS